MSKATLRNNDGNPFVYLEGATGSTAIGVDTTSNNDVNLITSDAVQNLDPASGSASITVQSTTPGDIKFAPKGTGQSTFVNGSVEILADGGSDGNLLMQDTVAAGISGVIEYGGNRFIHNYGTFNTFIGENAGNFSLVVANARNNTGVGYQSLVALTGVTGGEFNTALGTNSAKALTVGHQNTAIGFSALGLTSTGTDNTALGFSALKNLQGSSSNNNVAMGSNAGGSLTTNSSNNIMIGNIGTFNDARTLRIGNTMGGDSLQKCFIGGISGTSVTATKVVVIDGAGQLGGSNGSNGQLLIGGGSGPVWANVTSSDSSIGISNGPNSISLTIAAPVDVAHGGTGLTSVTDHSVVVGSGTSAVTPLTVGTNGQVLVGSTGADPAFATLTSTGGTVTFTTGAASLNLEVTTPLSPWTEVVIDTDMDVDNGYIVNDGSRIDLTLPAVAPLGSTFKAINKGAGGWKIVQRADQFINFGFLTSTVGVTGYIQSSEVHNCIEIVCITADIEFIVVDSAGNITVV